MEAICNKTRGDTGECDVNPPVEVEPVHGRGHGGGAEPATTYGLISRRARGQPGRVVVVAGAGGRWDVADRSCTADVTCRGRGG